MSKFSELPLSAVLQTNLARHGFVEATPVQSQAIPPALSGRDIVATAQTGTGKTLAFVLPMLETLSKQPVTPGVRAVILSPTRELAIQIHETFVKVAAGTGFRAAVVVGGLSENTQLRAIRSGAQVLIATPGRLCDFLDRKLVALTAVGCLVLDEGDRMLDMGFLPAIQAILKTMPANRQTLFFSATLETSVVGLIHKYIKDPVRIATSSVTKTADQVDLNLYEVEQDRKLSLLMHLLEEEQGSFLVFARTKHGVEKLAKKLDGIKTGRIHGDRTQAQRNQALKGFQKGDYRVLVATDVAARGIHVDGIAHVVNYDIPGMAEDFIHRVGRTGRAGSRGVAHTFVTSSERRDIRQIERTLKISLVKKPVPTSLAAEVRGPRVESVQPERGNHNNYSKPRSFAPRRNSLRRAS
jgi:ATP-dependent RNA helicase RhlE